MADLSRCLPLTRESVQKAHEIIKPYVHLTPTLTCQTLDDIASTPQSQDALKGTQWEGQEPAKPKLMLLFKCENYQKVGAFKARGAFHALSRLTEEELKKGVVTHSSGNHAQALAYASRTKGVKAYVVMPTVSTPSKIAATKGYGAEVTFSGSTSQEREAVVADVIKKTGAIPVPPYDHPDIILGQGTMALELEQEAQEILDSRTTTKNRKLNAVITPCGGGGMLSGVATALSGTGTLVFGAEPSFQGADDARRGLLEGKRITTVKSLTIADGVRTPVGEIPWNVISDKTKVRSIYAVTEEQIKAAMRLVLERMKVFIEPTAAVGLATVLYNEDFRRLAEKGGGEDGWNIGVVFSGGNTTLEAISKIFETNEHKAERAERKAENIAG